MGFLHYGSNSLPIEDRTLVHLQIAINTKLQHDERFFLSWRVPRSQGSGRMSAWISTDVPLLFQFEGSRVPRINRRWVEQLIATSSKGPGLVLLEEPAEEEDAPNRA